MNCLLLAITSADGARLPEDERDLQACGGRRLLCCLAVLRHAWEEWVKVPKWDATSVAITRCKYE